METTADIRSGDGTVDALLAAQAEAWRRGDADAVAAGFAEDAEFVSPIETYRGRAAIRKAAAGFFAYAARVEIELRRAWTDGRHGVVEWAWREEARDGGAVRRADDAIVFEVRNARFVAWREYVNWRD
ncbi:MAG: nuclear transport factor 2 family protein [Planctomycetota bacterium]